jgi:DNA-binding NtrC family response regulator
MSDEESTAHALRIEGFDGQFVSEFALEVTQGVDAPLTFTVSGSQPSRLYLGKSSRCDLRLSDPLVSRRHVALEPEGGYLRVTDLESLNGTFVNGLRVGDARLVGGETLRIGDTSINVTKTSTKREPLRTLANRFGRVVGASPEMRRIFPLCERFAKSDVPIIIEGETGTGKELLAEAIHEASARSKGPFIVFDCAAISPHLTEAALFGHERGAVPGTASAGRGVFEQANGGTLLFDEVGDLDLVLQAKVLRALERSEIQRIGSTTGTRIDVRVLCVTRRDLEREIQAGRFRDDLLYRLAASRIELPPLRRRTGDIAVLVHHFWQALRGPRAELTPDVIARFESYSWPGNVRELYNAIAQRIASGSFTPLVERISEAVPAALPSGLERLRASDSSGALPAPPRRPSESLASVANLDRPSEPAPVENPPTDVINRVMRDSVPFITARALVLNDFERRYCEWVLEKNGGNVTKAAASSGIARRYFYVLKNRSKG